MWLAYRTPENKIFLGQRHKHLADNRDCRTEYSVIDLSCNPATMAESKFAPSLCGFDTPCPSGVEQKMYLAWKPENSDVIKYQRTDSSLHFEFPAPKIVEAEHIVAGPVLATTSNAIWLCWLAGPAYPDGTYDIYLSESSDGIKFDTFNYSKPNRHARTRYPPCFSARNDVLIIHWINGCKVHSGEVNPDDTEFDTHGAPKLYDFEKIYSHPDYAMRQGTSGYYENKVPVPIGIACAYADNKRWLVVTTSDDQVWVLPPHGDTPCYTLTAAPAEVKSAERVGAAFVEITPERRQVFINWKDEASKNYRECRIRSHDGDIKYSGLSNSLD